jgi:hypothetical protein
MKWGVTLLIMSLVGCAKHQQIVNIKVALANSNHSLQIFGFEKMIINDIGQDTSKEAWQSLLPVYKMPADTDMKDFQNAQPGKYSVKDSLVVFTPDTPFRKGQEYFLRAFDYSGAKDAWDFIRKQKGKGSAGHKDLLFKY